MLSFGREMNLTTEQKDRLWGIQAYEWVEQGLSKEEIFKKVESPFELFYMSIVAMWDVSEGDFDRFIDHPQCDLGLALLIYWKLDREDARNELLFNKIEWMVSNSEFISGHIQFDIYSIEPSVRNKGSANLLISTDGDQMNLNYPEVLR